jgi:hypothetical protein
MQAIGCPDRHVVGRKDNIVIVDFRGADPPAPYFPGAGALRAAVLAHDEAPGGLHEQHNSWQQRLIA